MRKLSDQATDWDSRKEAIVGLGEHSLHKNYYPQLRENVVRLERFRLLLDQTSDIVILVEVVTQIIVDANTALARLLGCATTTTLIGQSLQAVGLHELALAISPPSSAVAGTEPAHPGGALTIEWKVGEAPVWLEFTHHQSLRESKCYSVILGRDITERRQQHELITTLLSEKETLLENATIGIVMLKNRVIQSCNHYFEKLFGYPRGGLTGISIRRLYPSEEGFATFGAEAYRALGNDAHFTGTQMFMRADGSTMCCEVTGHALDPLNPKNDSIWLFTDITKRRQAEERATFLAYHDGLTGLPNMQIVQDRTTQAIRFARQTSARVALLILDLDRFKTINDSLGFQNADQLLVDVARRLQASLQDTATVCRQSGDKFLVLLPAIDSQAACLPIVDRIFQTLGAPFFMLGQEISITTSIGISLFPEDGDNLEVLLRHAELAVYQAKDSGRNTYRFFDRSQGKQSSGQLNLYSNLRRALENEQFELYFQPQIEIVSKRLIGAEALIRWNHPELGRIPPAEFIPAAEFSGLIVPIGEWVLRKACEEAARWKVLSPLELVVAVNLSALQFKRGNVEQSVLKALHDSSLEPARLELELTESILIHDTEEMLSTIVRLKNMGLKLSIDDFGTGYSSLSYLKRFKVDKLKIDQSFVRSLTTQSEDASIVRAVIQMARGLGLQTIAEGVEDRQSLEMLDSYECDEAQGYFFARPMPAEDFRQFILQATEQ